MKRTSLIYLFPFLTSLLLALSGCDKFLEEEPNGQLTPKEAFATLDDVKNNAVLAIYHNIGGNKDSNGLQGTGRGVFDFNSLTTDEAIMPTRGGDWYDGGFWRTLFLHTWDGGTSGLKDVWDYLFQTVMLCNEYIERVKTYQVTHDDAVLGNYVAELRAVRALYYFYLMDFFGRVPLVTTTNISTSRLQQASRPELFKFIYNELQASIPLLEPTRSNVPGEYYGRMTRPVAWFIMAKLTLNAEVYLNDEWTKKPSTDGNFIQMSFFGKVMNVFDICANACDSIKTYGYTLEPNFSDNFSPNNEQSRENIFTIPMDPVLYKNRYNYFYRSRHYNHGAALGAGSENGTAATVELINAFGYGEGIEDPRFRKTFYAEHVIVNGKQVLDDDGKTPLFYYPKRVRLDLTGTPYEKTGGARLAKYAHDPDANEDGRACHNDIVLFRYADVLLMKAEALVRNGYDGAEPLNEVRRRTGLDDAEATLTNILHERYLELAWEGWRRNDMIRFGIYANPYSDRPSLPGEDDRHTTVFPIPNDLLTMHPTWTQNPGY